jgi:hypothetical protein
MAYFAYFDPANFLYDPYQFRGVQTRGRFWASMMLALVFSVIIAPGIGMGRLDEADAKVSAELVVSYFERNESLVGNSLN